MLLCKYESANYKDFTCWAHKQKLSPLFLWSELGRFFSCIKQSNRKIPNRSQPWNYICHLCANANRDFRSVNIIDCVRSILGQLLLRLVLVLLNAPAISLNLISCIKLFSGNSKRGWRLENVLLQSSTLLPKLGFFNSKLTSSPEWCNKRFFVCLAKTVFLNLILKLSVASKNERRLDNFINCKLISSLECNKHSFLCLVFSVFLAQFFSRWKSTDGLYLVIFSAGHLRAIQRGLLPFRLQL